MNSKIFYERHLPHYHPQGNTFFITFRLAGTLPAEIVRGLKNEREKELSIISSVVNDNDKKEKYKECQSKYFGKFDKLLDSYYHGPIWLKDHYIAQIVYNAILFRDKKEYDLIAFTIMPNHVHILFSPIEIKAIVENKSDTNITTILQGLKKFTAKECNKILNRSGSFWQYESYDHVVKNDKELKNITNYILNNPVKANLCKNQEDWKYSYINYDHL
jgi:putative transposase